MPSDREHFVHGAVADRLAPHAFGKIAQRFLRLARAEKIHFWIGDAVLDDPWHEGGVEIARDHCLGFLRFHIALIDVGRVGRSETELEFQQTLRRHSSNFINVRKCVSETGIHEVVVRAKARLYTDGIRRDRGETEQECKEGKDKSDAGDQAEHQSDRLHFSIGRCEHLCHALQF